MIQMKKMQYVVASLLAASVLQLLLRLPILIIVKTQQGVVAGAFMTTSLSRVSTMAGCSVCAAADEA